MPIGTRAMPGGLREGDRSFPSGGRWGRMGRLRAGPRIAGFPGAGRRCGLMPLPMPLLCAASNSVPASLRPLKCRLPTPVPAALQSTASYPRFVRIS